MKTLAIWVLVLVVIGGGAWLAYSSFFVEKETAMSEDGELNSAPQFSWQFAEEGEDEATGAPMTSVTLIVDGEARALGTFMGSCLVVDGTSWELVESELTGAICYFAGGGDELGVFAEGDGYVVKKGIVEEGSAEVPGFRGDFETILSL